MELLRTDDGVNGSPTFEKVIGQFSMSSSSSGVFGGEGRHLRCQVVNGLPGDGSVTVKDSSDIPPQAAEGPGWKKIVNLPVLKSRFEPAKFHSAVLTALAAIELHMVRSDCSQSDRSAQVKSESRWQIFLIVGVM